MADQPSTRDDDPEWQAFQAWRAEYGRRSNVHPWAAWRERGIRDSSRAYHAALQRIGGMLGLLPGADVTKDIEAKLRELGHGRQ